MGSFFVITLNISNTILSRIAAISLFLALWPITYTADASDQWNYGVQLRWAVSTDAEMPFWIHSNRFGEIDRYGNNSIMNAFGSWSYGLPGGIHLTAGTDVLFRVSGESELWLQEGYIKFNYRGFNLRAGRKSEQSGLVDPELSLGSMDWSANARPFNNISFSTESYRPVPWTQNYLFYDAHIAHGWMGDNDYRYVEDPWVHSKSLYLRLFGEEHSVNLFGGVSHYVLWSGYSPRYGEVPSDWQAFKDVFLSRTPDTDEIIDGGQLANQFQNHGGIYDFAAEFFVDDYSIKLGRQFMLEDTPNARFAAPWDGLWSLTIRDKSGQKAPVTGLVYEHINTLEQLTNNPKREGRTANYYNHGHYRGGWTYYGRVIGTPLYYGDQEHLGVINNELIGHHLGISGYFDRIAYRALATYSRNYGARRPENFDRKDQYSFMLELTTEIRSGLSLTTTFSGDIGEVYEDNFGMMAGIRWQTGR